MFYEEWQPRIEKLAAFHGLQVPDREDFVQQFFTDLYANGFLDAYDSALGTFETYVYQKARWQILEAKRTFWKRGQREHTSEALSGGAAAPLHTRTPRANTPAPDLLQPLQLASGTDDPAFAIVELNETLAAVHAAIRQLPEAQVWDLAKLFRAMVTEFAETGVVRQSALLLHFGVSHQALSQHVAKLRTTAPLNDLREACRA